MEARAIFPANDALVSRAAPGAAARAFRAFERLFDRPFGPPANPVRQLGALGFYFFWVIVASGAYIYAFFDTSVIGAYQSVESLTHGQWYLGGVMRSLHRYASDAFIVVMLLHLARELAYGRFTRFRWFSWVSGVPLIWLAIASGIGGYWLVWDQLAQFIGLATTEWFGALPGFDPGMVRNFLESGTLSDRLFSLLVFLHIGIPLLLLLGMWIHVQRITQARTHPHRRLGLGVFGMLLILSLIHPALSQPQPDLAREPLQVGVDWFYLFAYPFIYRGSPDSVWAVLAGTTLILCALPWMVRAPAQPIARVSLANCNGCGRCFADCPYAAIVLVPRSDGRPHPKQAMVIDDLCAGCGICAGACPSSTPFRTVDELRTGVDMPQAPIGELRARMERAIARLSGEERILVFGCNHGLDVRGLMRDSVAALSLECIGMLPPSFVEYALRNGVSGVMVVGCAQGECEFRFGAQWTSERIDGTRAPRLRRTVPQQRVRVIWTYDSNMDRTRAALAAFRQELADARRATMLRELPPAKKRRTKYA